MNYIVQIPSEGIIVKLQIWLSEIEEREGNERWLLSLTPPRKAVENILVPFLVTGRILCRPFDIFFLCLLKLTILVFLRVPRLRDHLTSKHPPFADVETEG